MYGPLAKTKAVLEVYLKRGQEAVIAGESGDWDSFVDLLRDRKAAFNNFRYWDYVALQYNSQYGADQPFQDLWQLIRKNNSQIEMLVRDLCQQLNHSLVKATHNREKVGKFRSAIRKESGINLGV